MPIADKDSHVLACTSYRPRKNAVMLEDVHCAFHEQGDHLAVQDARRADLRRERRDTHVDKRVMEDTGIGVISEDLADRVELHHRFNLGYVHAGEVECGDIESGRAGMEIDRDVGVGPQQPVEQEPGVPAGRRDAVLVTRPFPIHIDEIMRLSPNWAIGAACLRALGGTRPSPP